jgi:hypothetical protein
MRRPCGRVYPPPPVAACDCHDAARDRSGTLTMRPNRFIFTRKIFRQLPPARAKPPRRRYLGCRRPHVGPAKSIVAVVDPVRSNERPGARRGSARSSWRGMRKWEFAASPGRRGGRGGAAGREQLRSRRRLTCISVAAGAFRQLGCSD